GVGPDRALGRALVEQAVPERSEARRGGRGVVLRRDGRSEQEHGERQRIAHRARSRHDVPVVRPVSVYVHFPWCLKKCPYCDFNSHATPREAVPHDAYADAVLAELRFRADKIAPDASLVSVFFGGGTPSLWEPRALGRVLAGVRAAFPRAASEIEI